MKNLFLILAIISFVILNSCDFSEDDKSHRDFITVLCS